MAPLVKGKAAYDKLDEGYKALAENHPERALTLAREALRIEPQDEQTRRYLRLALAQLGEIKAKPAISGGAP